MSSQINAEIIAIGTEILLGEITDTNSVYLAQQLRGIGINLYYMTSVGDNEARIAAVIEDALQRAQVVITCGGLGPTVDDMTRQAVARATGRTLVFHQALLDKIAERFAGFRSRMTDNNKRQAFLPDQAIPVENPVGTAPAFIVEHEGRVVISLPGVPREMKYLTEHAVIPFLRERYGLAIIKAHVLRTAGLGESTLDDRLGSEILEMMNPTVGLAAHSGQVDVRITAKAESETEADAMIAAVELRVRERIGDFIYGADGDTLEDALAEALKARGLQLAIVEAGVPGSIRQRMERAGHVDEIAYAERYAHPDEAEPGDAPLRMRAETIARRLASAAPDRVGIAVLSDPTREDDRADSDEGSAFAVCLGDNVRSRAYGFGGASETAQTWSGTWALSMAWQMTRGERGAS
ncbi:MAG: CinA family nicotinamide mononucleotide deamidase-related protein [Anaerolineae bacterium]|nr:CinA family nicotinamide mononucleotide deamidase-related protein [Anaerolineae bacterium]